MAERYKSNKQNKSKGGFYRFLIVPALFFIILFILNVSVNYIKDANEGKISLIINNNNVTAKLKHDILIKDDIVYISKDDIKNYFDGNIYYDEKYEQIVTTSDTKVAVLPINKKQIVINEVAMSLNSQIIKEKEDYYIPFIEISGEIYNIESKYIKETNTVIASSLNKELVQAVSSKNSVKFKPTLFSKSVDELKKGDLVTIISENDDVDGWTKVLTENGKIGYVENKTLSDRKKVRGETPEKKQIEGHVSIAWDYFSEYKKAPQRSEFIEGVNVLSPSFIMLKKEGKGEIINNIGQEGISYIKWAHSKGYRVWALVSNNSLKDTTSEILSDYKLREIFINNIVSVAEKYELDGINLDFENIYEKDKDNFTKLVVELSPRIRNIDKVVSINVTAPDGAADWSLCYDRNKLAKAADYLVFMAYDQNGASSTKVGTTAGYNWVENNLKKFVDENREGVDSSKIILGIPFYSRLWKIKGNDITSEVVQIKQIDSKIPKNAEKKWDDVLHQNYVEYEQNGTTYKIWLEDLQSIKEKLDLINKYNLAGAAFWSKDMETSDVWKLVNSIL